MGHGGGSALERLCRQSRICRHGAWGMGEAVRWKGSADSHASAVMGHGDWKKNYYPLPITHYPLPITHYQCPMPNAQCPMPNAQCPMPNAPPPGFQGIRVNLK
ncbi:MAG: hypothetical protein KME31_02525 [Tolypothrix carrinoi HA7290-LM1]|jgi:hypothetical protein|nr:hypothetical protein [Tolypothrix carrinoi HA7290-LM1]